MIKTIANHAGRISRLRDWISRQPKWVIIAVAFGLCCMAGTFTVLLTQPPYRVSDSSVIDAIAKQYTLHDTTVFADARMHSKNIYLAAYGNNQLITYILMLVYKAASVVSTSESAFVGAATVINIALGSAAVVAISVAAYRIAQRRSFGLICYALSAFLIVLNPNLAPFYTDVPSLLIASTALLIMVHIFRANRVTYRQLVALAALTSLGLLIKPPSVIIIISFIAIAAFSAIRKRPIFAMNSTKVFTFFGTIALMIFLSNAAIALTPNFAKYTPQQIDRYRVDALHYFGMGSLRGLDPYPKCTMGAFCWPYVGDTIGVWGGQKEKFASQKARDKYALSLIKQSVVTDFPTGYLSFVVKKLTPAFFPRQAYYTVNIGITSHRLMWLHDNKAALQLRQTIYGKHGLYPTSVRILSFVAAASILVGLVRSLVDKTKDTWLSALLYLSLLLFVVYGTLSEFRAAYVWQFMPPLILLSAMSYLNLPRVTLVRTARVVKPS